KAFNVDVDDIVGGSIHRFHKNPRSVERILRNPAALPHEAKFTFGSITLQTRINGIFGPGQELLGYIVNWEDVSDKLEAERKIKEGNERERRQAEDLRVKVESILEVVNAATRGDLTRPMTVQGSDVVGQLGEGLAKFFAKARGNIGSIA